MTPSSDRTLENLTSVRRRIGRAAERVGRDPGSVTLVAAAKTIPAGSIQLVVDAGVPDVGENYVKELRQKRRVVRGARWHYIGALQASGAHHVAVSADVVQTLAGGRAAERLARRAAEAGRVLDSFIEVDLTGSRTGTPPEEVPELADRLVRLEGLRLVGLMTVPPIPDAPEDARPWFQALRRLRDTVREKHPGVLELSMGMSLDYEVAVEEGATMVRIGTALFGERPYA